MAYSLPDFAWIGKNPCLWHGSGMNMRVGDGIEVIQGLLKSFPTCPGVYRMLNDAGEVLYVGKARNLRARLTSYTQPERMSVRIRKMVFETREMVVVETRTEVEALLLEANLIKSLKPKYNIIFRDDASYVRVLITDEETPMIRSHRGAMKAKKDGGGTYFGPYPSAGAVYATLDLMERAFRLRTCSPSMFAHRTRPCLKYDIKRCSGPCVGKISVQDYQRTVEEAILFLNGERGAVLRGLQSQMEAAAERMAYEEAGAIRDRIRALSAVGGRDSSLTHILEDADVFALVAEGGKVAVQAFFYRNGQHVGNQVYYPTGTEEENGEGEILRVFLATHYANRPVPRTVCCNVEPADAEILAEAFAAGAGHKIALEVPKRGDKLAVVEQAERNARAALRRKVAESGGWRTQMEAFGAMLGRVVERVECYDISNISGRFPVASCVVAGEEGMLKNRYKRYTIRTKTTPDDYAMMREVLTRRISRGMKEGGLPSVLLVDGGKGQLNVLVDVARGLGILGTLECPALVGIAKGEERDKGLETLFLAKAGADNLGGPEAAIELEILPIPHESALIFMLQRVRDEAHRFAITFHRETRSKALEVSRLNAIPGIGANKKKALLLHFGSVEAIRGATEAELARVEGIGPRLAKIVFGFFQAE
jgi:excinuclease ABC subunit C